MKQSSDTVSVVIAAYNAAHFIERGIRSVLEQTHPILEVLVVDDASTDSTASVVRQIASQHKNIMLIQLGSNGGPSAARNAGLNAARGDWIGILDADDAFLNDRIEHMVETGRLLDADIVIDAFRSYDFATGKIGSSALGDDSRGPQLVSVNEYVMHARPFGDEADWGLLQPLYRRSFLNRNSLQYPLHSRHGEDFLFMFDALLKGARLVLSRRAGYLYTSRESGLSRTTINYRLMWEHTEALARDPRVDEIQGLSDSLAKRVEALKRLEAIHGILNLARRRDWIALTRKLLADHRARAMLGQKIVNRFRRTMGAD